MWLNGAITEVSAMTETFSKEKTHIVLLEKFKKLELMTRIAFLAK